MRARSTAVGSGVMAIGIAGVTSFIAVAAAYDSALHHYFHQWWFLLALVLFGLITLAGLYLIVVGGGKGDMASGETRTIKIKMKGDHNIGYIENLNVEQMPEPKVHLRKVEDKRKADALYVTKYEVAVEAPYRLARLCAIAQGGSVDNIAWTTDGFAAVSGGTLNDGSIVECISNVASQMDLTVVTTEPADVQIECEGDRQ